MRSSNRTCLRFFDDAISKFSECRSINQKLEALPEEASNYRLQPVSPNAKAERELYMHLEHQVAVCQLETDTLLHEYESCMVYGNKR